MEQIDSSQMPQRVLNIVGGPDKPALQWAVAYPGREQVHFRVEHDGIDAEIRRLDEQPDGFSFKVQGVVRSGSYSGARFCGFYSIETRAGTLTLEVEAA